MLLEGIDLLETERIRRPLKNPRFRSRVFGEAELTQLSARGFPVSSAAASFCAKEAFAKAVGTGLWSFDLRDAQLLRDEVTGRPRLELSGSALRLAAGVHFAVSVTHTRDHALVVVTGECCWKDALPENEGLRILRSALKPRDRESSKGDYGRLLCVCGSEGMAGAAVMSGGAALRCGAGIVEMALPASIYPIAASRLAEPVYTLLRPLAGGAPSVGDGQALFSALSRADAVLAGCGLGKSEAARSAVSLILREAKVPVLLDADGLNIVSEQLSVLDSCRAPLVLTPHPGEMARLTGKSIPEIQSRREETASRFAAEHHVVLALKGAGTVVAAPDGRIYRNTTGNPGMARGGSGDVLAGMIAAFLAQGIAPFDAAAGGVALHGLAGDRCAAEKSQTAMLPTDMIAMLPELFLALGR